MQFHPSDRGRSRLSSAWRAFLAVIVAVAFAGHGVAQAPASDAGAAPAPLSAEDLDALVGRIALYPDDLVAIVLPGSTFPLQIVQADRFLDKRKSDPKLQIDEKWDDSVKALVNYPDVVKMMSGDLDWTSALGEAVVADQGAVLEAIQAFRRRAQAAGNLKSNDKQIVEVEKTVIQIVPANPEVIYVPQYNPTTVVVAGAPAWGYYPTPYPVYYYPYAPGAAFATGLIWGAAIGAAWGGGHWHTNWGGGDININRNTNINTGNRNNINRGGASTLPARGGAGNTAWKSDKRPGQVSGATGRTNAAGSRVGDAGRGGSGFSGTSANRPAGGSFGGGGGAGAGANRPSAQPSSNFGGGGAANRAGSVSASPRDSFGGSSAGRGGSASGSGLGGYGSGRQTSMDSSRGAASRGSMSGGGGRSMGGGGGGRGGGGRGGGGGRR